MLLDRKGEDGATRRAHLELAAARGSETAARALEGPEAPETMLYLVDWAYALFGRSGASMAGLAPLAYSTIRDWAEMMGIDVTPLEVQALLVLDAVIRNPEPDERAAPEQKRERIVSEWPEKKNG